MPDLTIMDPYLQAGFAGLAFVLVGVIVWLIRRLLGLLRELAGVISANTEAMTRQNAIGDETRRMVSDVRDKLMKLRCVAAEDNEHLAASPPAAVSADRLPAR